MLQYLKDDDISNLETLRGKVCDEDRVSGSESWNHGVTPDDADGRRGVEGQLESLPNNHGVDQGPDKRVDNLAAPKDQHSQDLSTHD